MVRPDLDRAAHEDDLRWIKSSYSGGSGTECVEAASLGTAGVAIRDSKNPNGPRLDFSRAAWRSFVTAVRDDKLGGR